MIRRCPTLTTLNPFFVGLRPVTIRLLTGAWPIAVRAGCISRIVRPPNRGVSVMPCSEALNIEMSKCTISVSTLLPRSHASAANSAVGSRLKFGAVRSRPPAASNSSAKFVSGFRAGATTTALLGRKRFDANNYPNGVSVPSADGNVPPN